MNSEVISSNTREEWLAVRMTGIGSSDVSAIMDFYYPADERLDQRHTALDVYLDKIGRSVPREETEEMFWGNKLEPVIGEVYAERTGRRVVHMRNKILRHPEHPVILASPDFLIEGEPRGLECKSVGYWPGREWTDSHVPPQYWMQCQHCLIQPGFEAWDLVPLIAGQKFILNTVSPDEKIQAVMIECCERFWREHVEKRIPPICDHLPPNREQVKRLYPFGVESEIGATEEIENKIGEHLTLKKQAKELDENLEAVENKIKLFMGENGICRGSRFSATWKSSNGHASIDWEAVARQLYEELSVATDYHHGRGLQMNTLEYYKQKHTEVRPGARRFLSKESKNGK